MSARDAITPLAAALGPGSGQDELALITSLCTWGAQIDNESRRVEAEAIAIGIQRDALAEAQRKLNARVVAHEADRELFETALDATAPRAIATQWRALAAQQVDELAEIIVAS